MTDVTSDSECVVSTEASTAGTAVTGRPTVLVGLESDENRRLLVDWLTERFDVAILGESGALEDPFDLLVVDTATFRASRDRLLARKERDELGYLPYLLVSSADLDRLPRSVIRDVDDVVAAPVEQRKLRTCIEDLLDHRRQFGSLTRRNALIEALHGATQRMDGATDPERVCEIAVEAACSALGLPLTAIWLADETNEQLYPVAQTDERRRLFDSLSTISEADDELAWRAFAEGETKVADDGQSAIATDESCGQGPRLRSELLVPIGEYGVLRSGSVAARTLDENDVHGAEILAANTASALGRAEREQELARTTSQLEFFNSVVRHDVLNGMTVIQARADTLCDNLEDDQLHSYAETILTWSDEIVDIVQRVRAVVNAVTGEMSVDLDPVSLTGCLRDELDAIRCAYPEVTVETAIPDDVTVLADALLADVLGNILKNAIEHNDAADLSIRVAVETGPEFATVRISDTGTGIPDEQKESVFRRGETGHAKSTGSGFGLFFVDSMVTEYGGRVRIEDNDPTGTVFVVELPLSDAA